jgi:predicted CoA-binding protein
LPIDVVEVYRNELWQIVKEALAVSLIDVLLVQFV